MIGYTAVLRRHDLGRIRVPLEPDDEGLTVFAHSVGALMDLSKVSVRATLTGDEPTVAALVCVQVDPEKWGACCPTCYVPIDGAHTRNCERTGAVLHTEAVFRPREQVRT